MGRNCKRLAGGCLAQSCTSPHPAPADKRYEEALAQLEANKAAAAELERIFADVSGARSERSGRQAGRDLAIQEAQQNASTKAEAEKSAPMCSAACAANGRSRGCSRAEDAGSCRDGDGGGQGGPT
eukprot:scaffold21219_cov21-Tisochrysis_lutea.AAC.1